MAAHSKFNSTQKHSKFSNFFKIIYSKEKTANTVKLIHQNGGWAWDINTSSSPRSETIVARNVKQKESRL
jgi:hypothetical protein